MSNSALKSHFGYSNSTCLGRLLIQFRFAKLALVTRERRYRCRKVKSRPKCVPLFRISHSQITKLLQPSSLSPRTLLSCRTLFLLSFGSQYTKFDFGKCARRQLSCWCQKQPWTKIAVLYFGRRMSTETERGGRFEVSGVRCQVSGGIGIRTCSRNR
jgi:hypothetical protein